MHHFLEDAVLLGALGFGAYELYHLYQYGNFGIGNPYHHPMGYGGFGGYGTYGTPYGYSGFGYGHPYGHHHHHHYAF
ncbi:unnamed protein product [Rotaria sp. Silwood1]|nr:unnamed protein product [Rotaria sp. Silwood1]CAF3417088.1 unnamed protein product [Rotaria sp. Silwood1]CAF3441659.1 unnamed protein product [Rotaria sp. Silwood1]CAF4596247.1 unnamed protein product [Rotaria sp. Silwood1]CAF4653296.1 unnamed protein product [Rotaria sp. Silwood1]